MPAESVFISSTSSDLVEHRRAVNEALRKAGYHPVDMADFGARAEGATSASLEEVEDSDVFVGIYAWRYGFQPPGSEVSITEQEFLYARELDKQCFCFMVDPSFDWPQEHREEGDGAVKLQALKARIESELVRATFTTPDNLALQVVTSLTRRERGQQKLLLEATSAVIPGVESLEEAVDMIGSVLEAEEIEHEFDGDAMFVVPYGTTYLEIRVEHDDRLGLMVFFRAELASDVDLETVTGEVGARLLVLSYLLPIGGVSMDDRDGTVWYEYSLPADLLTEEVVLRVVGQVAVTADQLDEDVREMLPALPASRRSR